MRVLLVGYGKMGQLVEQLAVAQGMEIASRIDGPDAPDKPSLAAIRTLLES